MTKRDTETHLAVEEGDYFRECREQMLDSECAWVCVACQHMLGFCLHCRLQLQVMPGIVQGIIMQQGNDKE